MGGGVIQGGQQPIAVIGVLAPNVADQFRAPSLSKVNVQYVGRSFASRGSI